MDTPVLELNDSEIRLLDTTAVRCSSPGFALLRDGGVETGSTARAQARLHPRQVNDLFWERLGTDPLPNPHGSVRHHADLAFAHLNHIHRAGGEPRELVLAVPGHYTRDQLAVLLGIAKRCSFRAIGLVDGALAAACVQPLHASAVHVDIQLHQSVITHLSLSGETLSRSEVDIVPGAGLSQLQDRWARIITRSFIQQSRFDPMHAAASEQQLYDCMPGWLAALASAADTNAELSSGRSTYRAQIRSGELVDAARDTYRDIIDAIGRGDDGRPVLLSHRVAGLPGFLPHLPDAVALPARAVAAGCARHLQLIRSEDPALRFILRLPAERAIATANAPTAAPGTGATALPTHLATPARAFRLGTGTMQLCRADDGWRLVRDAATGWACTLRGDASGFWLEPAPQARLLCNEKLVSAATRVFAGDRIRMPEIDDAPLWLVTESAMDDTP